MTLATRHARFLIAVGIGLAVAAAAMALPSAPEIMVLWGVNAFFACYLGLMLRLARQATPAVLRKHAGEADEGVALIVVLATVLVAISLTAIFVVTNAQAATASPVTLWLNRGLALAAIPLGWAMVHTLAAFHYAKMFYRPASNGRGAAPLGGLAFPGGGDPGAWDFLYFSFGIGMTAQVADITTTTARMRRAVLLHAVASFFYNTVIIALAVNAAVTLGA